jgi:hypothetical protein
MHDRACERDTSFRAELPAVWSPLLSHGELANPQDYQGSAEVPVAVISGYGRGRTTGTLCDRCYRRRRLR